MSADAADGDPDQLSLVLVHGGAHAADCWDPTIQELRRRAPNLSVLAINLPGRAGEPGDLKIATLDEWRRAALSQIDAAGIDRFVLVGHSLAGLTMPGVAMTLGPARVRGMVFAACSVPPDGGALVDTLRGPLRRYATWIAHRGKPVRAPGWLARYLFCNGMTGRQRRFAQACVVAESTHIFLEPVRHRQLSTAIPRVWILTARDRAMTPRSQRASIAELGNVTQVIPVDTCHNLMISRPDWLADVLIEHHRRWS